ncbi:MAG: nickel pincer cofactor biosynthesis protein LarB [Pseudonocardia sp.]|uniref:nickel pincer cofactor biosynthesis protein LarB n=1 Tax=unclassified Pseudonocardia TaxID=2619320 RepID=UPI00086BE83E|nr:MULTISPECIES: nickel pincer cofactor biosynthesis protein LarB [unclassified Pseudonocardia]MBN9109143.1 nickel pincer cofactor biosynthesis protein LarB [Pseudonocardia sp.]ODU05109.1 MAG: hypothetical protein ABS80_25320 [Pseudonocardia sp. SCN 72-51]ODV01444.1 MAG: hypothetical protein ABT15_27240 [Pseudonocardia sp. SCN 73-27]
MTGFDDLGHSRPDTDREARQGLPEVVFGPGKTVAEIAAVVTSLLAANEGPVLVTRVEPEVAAAVLAQVGNAGTYVSDGRLLVWRPAAPRGFVVAVVSAGTSDGPVAAEAAAVADAAGLTVRRIADVGVAGLHRLLAVADDIAAADAVVCVAGMEGALPSVVGGLVGSPVIAVPTSVGYGATMQGVTALLAMMSSCAAGMTVVNIDSGFSAAMAAFRIAVSRDRVPVRRSDNTEEGRDVERMVHLETNVDDVTGEVLGHLLERLLAAGAADAWVAPVVMKKSRPAHSVHVLAARAVAGDCERIVFAETGTLGVRRTLVERVALPRSTSVVDVGGHPVRVKRGPWGVKPEHDDVAAAATALGLPLRAVAARALASAQPVADSSAEETAAALPESEGLTR